MTEHIVKIIRTENVTHNVKRFTITKPSNYKYIPGQATEVSINKPEWKDERRPFTFTSLNEDLNLEFIIKIYPERNGVTNALNDLNAGDELILHDVWGVLNYKGPGVFIAAGAGITPFIAILRQLHKENKIEDNHLIFSNRTSSDIILKDELEHLMGKKFVNVLTREGNKKHIDKEFLANIIHNFRQHFYVCGPDNFVSAINEALVSLGAKTDTVVFEK